MSSIITLIEQIIERFEENRSTYQYLNEQQQHTLLRQSGRVAPVIANIVASSTNVSNAADVSASLSLAQEVLEAAETFKLYDESSGSCASIIPGLALTTLADFSLLGAAPSADVSLAVMQEVATTIVPKGLQSLVSTNVTGDIVIPFTSSVDGEQYVVLAYAGSAIANTSNIGRLLVHVVVPNPAAELTECPEPGPTPHRPCEEDKECEEDDDDCEEENECGLHNFEMLSC